MSNRQRFLQLAGLAILACGSAAAGCADGGELPAVSNERTVDAGLSREPDSGLPRVYELSVEPTAVVGGHDERVEYQLAQPVGALLFSDGRFAIADAGRNAIRLYGNDGGYLHTIGGPGSGPGEFRRLYSISRIGGDTITAWDRDLQRLTSITHEGEVARITSVAEAVRQMRVRYADLLMTVNVHALDRGWHLLETATVEPQIPAATMVEQIMVPVVLLRGDGSGTTLLGMFPGPEVFYHKRSGMMRRFGTRLQLATNGEVIYVASSGDSIVAAWSPFSGQKIYEIAVPGARQAVSSQVIESTRASWIGRMREVFADAPVDMLFAQHYPLFSDLLADADGRLWIQLYPAPSDDTWRWLVYDSGNLVGRTELAANTQLLDVAHGFALTMVTDDLDVATIRVHELNVRVGGR
jgi:hypothetical protein